MIMVAEARGSSMSKKKKPSWDWGADGPANRERLRVEERGHLDETTGKMINPNNRRGVRRETWVDRYERKGKLSVAQAQVARWLRDASEGRRSQDPLAALSGPVDGGSYFSDPQAEAFDRRRAFLRVWAHMPLWAKPVIERVVIEDRPVRSLCTSGQQEARHLDRLQRGLDHLRDVVDEHR